MQDLLCRMSLVNILLPGLCCLVYLSLLLYFTSYKKVVLSHEMLCALEFILHHQVFKKLGSGINCETNMSISKVPTVFSDLLIFTNYTETFVLCFLRLSYWTLPFLVRPLTTHFHNCPLILYFQGDFFLKFPIQGNKHKAEGLSPSCLQ
jgi:hypothetical protein